MMTVQDTSRLTFRLLSDADKQLLWELDQDPEVMRYINGGKCSTMEDMDNILLPRMYKYRNPEKGWGMWGVWTKDDNIFIGWILVRPCNFFNDDTEYDNMEMGWRFNRSTWGKGYATEAARAVADEQAKLDEVKKLSAIAVPDNEASRRIMEKLGMDYIRTYLHKDPIGDVEAVYYEMTV